MPSGLIIVTGGSRGIGAAICRRLAADGHAVAVNYAADAKAADTTVAEIKKSGGRAQAFQADVADSAQLHRLFEQATEALGPLAGVVNNAGVSGRFAPTGEREAAELTQLFQINVIGTILACKEAVLRLSTKHGGSGGAIVNISSIAARLGGLPGLASYAATKGAVESFTKGLATEVGPEGIRANVVAPGFTATDMNRDVLAQASFRERIEGMTPLRRVGAPEEIAEAAAWLISPAAAFVTGSVLTVSGGR
ncbi:MAG TPA: SDR family oxidoreductase [Roseiarcus sp.]|jgi:NAD(P)-dependent dehydrogenase (short-subunit alcohol dehydrogenase family)